MANERLPYILDFQNGSVVNSILKKAEQLPDKAQLDQQLAQKATMSDVQRETQNLQNQINQIVRAPESGGDVGAEVFQARVGVNGTDYPTLSARLDANERSLDDVEAEVEAARTDAYSITYPTLKDRCDKDSDRLVSESELNRDNLSEVSRLIGTQVEVRPEYNTHVVPKTDGTFYEDTTLTALWWGSGYVEIPEGAFSIAYRGAGYSTANPITPIAFYDSNKNFISGKAVTNVQKVYSGIIPIPATAKYFYMTEFTNPKGSVLNSNNYSRFFFKAKYNLGTIDTIMKAWGNPVVLFDESQYTSNQIYHTDGSAATYSGWASTDFIECSSISHISYDSYAFSDAGTGIDVAYIAFFDINYKMIACLKSSDTTNGEKQGSVDVPESAVYVRAVTSGSITPFVQFNASGIGAELDVDYLSTVPEAIGLPAVTIGSNQYTDNQIYQANGTHRSFAGWYSTGFIPCAGRPEVAYDSYAYSLLAQSIDVAYVSFFDSKYNMISCLKSSDTRAGEKVGTTPVPEGASFVRGVRALSIDSYLKLAPTGLLADGAKIEAVTSLTYDSLICCIGDSLTQGVDVGSHLIKENYPHFLSEYLHCSILNYGQMGRTSKTWWDNYKNTYTYTSDIDVVLIMFGTNGGLTVNTLDTDVEPYNDPDDYADTNVGCYCKLIEKIMTDTQNHAQIILLTPSYSTYTTAQENTAINTEPVVRAIAKRYQLPVIDVLNECGMGKFNGSVFRPHDGCHFNAKGYHRLGTFLGSKIKAIVSTFDVDESYPDETTDT